MSRQDVPSRMHIDPSGSLIGGTRTYVKRLEDMASVYFDADAFGAALRRTGGRTVVYEVREQSYSSEPGGLIVGTSRLRPGMIGDEFAVTRGHLHAISNRAELYHCLSGHGVMLLETVDGASETVELRPGDAVNVPGDWIHRSVNVGAEDFVTVFSYSADAGQDYSIISDAGGMVRRIVAVGADGWAAVPNSRHRGYRVVA